MVLHRTWSSVILLVRPQGFGLCYSFLCGVALLWGSPKSKAFGFWRTLSAYGSVTDRDGPNLGGADPGRGTAHMATKVAEEWQGALPTLASLCSDALTHLSHAHGCHPS